MFLGGNDNTDHRNKAIGTHDPTILPEKINQQANDMHKIVDALIVGPGVAVVVVALKAEAYGLADIWGRLMVHQWKAGTERVQQYVKLKQRYQ